MAYIPGNPNGQTTMANSAPVVVASDQSAIPVSGTLALDTTSLAALETVELGATTLAALETINAAQSGAWNITNVSGTVSLPTGAATEVTLAALDAKVTACNTGAVTISAALPAGANAIGKLAENTGVDIGDVTINNASGASAVNIQDGGNSITVDGTVTANAGTGTFNISGAVTNTVLSVVGGGTEATAQRVTIASDSTGVLSVDDNGGSLTVDAPVGTPVFVRLSDGASAISTLPVSIATVPSHAVTNAGTFAVQDSQVITDNGAFTDGTSKLYMDGFIYDEVAGTALTENDAAAARINVNRAQVAAIEDGVTRGRYATVTAANAVKVDGSAVTQPVSGTFWQATQPVSAASLPLPTGAATETTLAALNTKVTACNTGAVVLSSGTVTTVSTVTSVSQFAGNAINLGAGTTSTGTLRTVEAGAGTGTQTNPSLSTVSATLLAAAATRRGATVFNGSTSIVYVRLSATAASSTTYTVKMQPEDYYEVPAGYNGAITAILNTGTTTAVQVTEIT